MLRLCTGKFYVNNFYLVMRFSINRQLLIEATTTTWLFLAHVQSDDKVSVTCYPVSTQCPLSSVPSPFHSCDRSDINIPSLDEVHGQTQDRDYHKDQHAPIKCYRINRRRVGPEGPEEGEDSVP